MTKFNYRNWNDQASYNTQNTVLKVHRDQLQNSESQSSSVLQANIFDKLFKISDTAKEAASQVIAEMGDDLKAEARKAAEGAAKAEVNKKAQEIEKIYWSLLMKMLQMQLKMQLKKQ